MTDIDEALIPLDVLRERLGLSRFQLHRRLVELDVKPVQIPRRKGKAVKWGDIVGLFAE